MRLTIILTLCLWGLTAHSQNPNSLYGSVEYSEFDGFGGLGYVLSYERNIYSFLAVEVSLSNYNGNSFPNEFMSSDYTDTFVWFDKNQIIDLSIRPHITFINTQRNFLSFFVGIGYMKLNSDTYVGNEYYSGRLNRVSRSLGFQYKYFTKSDFFIGLRATEHQAISKKNLKGLIDYSVSGGIIIGKRF